MTDSDSSIYAKSFEVESVTQEFDFTKPAPMVDSNAIWQLVEYFGESVDEKILESCKSAARLNEQSNDGVRVLRLVPKKCVIIIVSFKYKFFISLIYLISNL